MEFEPWQTVRVFQQLVPGRAKKGLSCRAGIKQAQCTSKMNIPEYKRQCAYQSSGLDGPRFFLATCIYHIYLHILATSCYICVARDAQCELSKSTEHKSLPNQND